MKSFWGFFFWVPVIFLVLGSVNCEESTIEETLNSTEHMIVEDTFASNEDNLTDALGPINCSQNVFDFMKETAKTVWQSQILPELQNILIEKDQKIAQIRSELEDKDRKIVQMDSQIARLERSFNNQFDTLKPKVIFEARKLDSGSPYFNGNITFDEISLNIGGGMNLNHFKAPFDGYYRFSFSGTSQSHDTGTETTVRVKRNGISALSIHDGNNAFYADGNNMAFTWIWSLTEGETVSFYAEPKDWQEYISGLSSTKSRPLIFIGELVYQD